MKERLDVKANKGQITSSKRSITSQSLSDVTDGLMFRISAFQLFYGGII